MKIKETIKKHKKKLIVGGSIVSGSALLLVGYKIGRRINYLGYRQMFADLIRQEMGDYTPGAKVRACISAKECGLFEYGDLMYEIKVECMGD